MLREMSSGPCPWGGRWLQIDPSIKWIQFGLQMALALEMRLERRERPRISRALASMGGRVDVIHGMLGSHCRNTTLLQSYVTTPLAAVWRVDWRQVTDKTAIGARDAISSNHKVQNLLPLNLPILLEWPLSR